MILGSYLLRDMSSGMNSMTANDKVLVFKKGSTDSNGAISVDVSDIFRDGASVSYFMSTPVTVSNGAIAADSDVVKSGAVVVGIIGQANDLAFTGGKM